jgi:hypothetical protein
LVWKLSYSPLCGNIPPKDIVSICGSSLMEGLLPLDEVGKVGYSVKRDGKVVG